MGKIRRFNYPRIFFNCKCSENGILVDKKGPTCTHLSCISCCLHLVFGLAPASLYCHFQTQFSHFSLLLIFIKEKSVKMGSAHTQHFHFYDLFLFCSVFFFPYTPFCLFQAHFLPFTLPLACPIDWQFGGGGEKRHTNNCLLCCFVWPFKS